MAVVTGGGSGLGRGIARTLLSAGWDVVVAGRREPELLETLGRQAPCAGAGSGSVAGLAVPTDVSIPDSVTALFDVVRERWGRLDLLVNNAGVSGPGGAVDELDPAHWQHIVNVNLTGFFLCAHHAVKLMKTQDPRGGRIINNGSISAHAPRPRSVGYTATKHAITGLTKSISLDCRPFDIACGQIDIGNAATELTTRDQSGRAAGRRVGQSGADVRPAARRRRGALHGLAAAGRQRPVPDHHRHEDAVHRPRLAAWFQRRRHGLTRAVSPGRAACS